MGAPASPVGVFPAAASPVSPGAAAVSVEAARPEVGKYDAPLIAVLDVAIAAVEK